MIIFLTSFCRDGLSHQRNIEPDLSPRIACAHVLTDHTLSQLSDLLSGIKQLLLVEAIVVAENVSEFSDIAVQGDTEAKGLIWYRSSVMLSHRDLS